MKSTDKKYRRIAAEGARAAQRRFKKSRRQIRDAMTKIEVEAERNGGIYPLARGRISVAEVLRRAGKSEAYLRKIDEQPSLEKLKEEVENFVKHANVLKGAGTIRASVTKRVADVQATLQAELDHVRQCYLEAEQDYSDNLNRLATAEKTIKELRAENDALRRKLFEVAA